MSSTSESPPAAPGSRLSLARRLVREVGLALVTLGVIVLLFAAYQLFGTNFAQHHSQSKLAKAFRSEVSSRAHSPTVGTGGLVVSPPPGQAIAHLVIPAIGVNQFVVQGVSEADLSEGPGHYPQTPMPGELGNSAIAGHRTTYGAPFFELNRLKVGDDIYVTDSNGDRFLYKVSRPPFVVSPSDVAVLDQTPYAELTLTTCNPRFSATSRLIVVARLVGRAPLPAPPPSELAAAPTVKGLSTGNAGAWPLAAAWGGVVVLLWVATRVAINRTRRWRRLLAYVVGIAACLVPLWFCFEAAARLLPQSL